MRSHTLPALFAGLLAVNVWNIADGADLLPWAPDLATAQQQAAEQGKLVLMHFWSPDCAPCLRLESTVFADRTVADIVARDYVPVKVNVKQAPTLAYQYGVKGWPTDVVTTPDGRAIHQPLVTPQDSHQFTSALSQATATERVYGVGRVGGSAAPNSAGPADRGLASYDRGQSSISGASPSRFGAYSNPAYASSGPAGSPPAGAVPPPAGDGRYDSRRDPSFGAVDRGRRPQPPQAVPGEVYNQYVSRRRNPTLAARGTYGNRPAETGPLPQQGPAVYGPSDASRGSAATDYASRQLEPASTYRPASPGVAAPAPARNREQDELRQDRYRPVAEPELGASNASQPAGRTASRQQPAPWSTDANRYSAPPSGRPAAGYGAAVAGPGASTVAPHAARTGSSQPPSPSAQAGSDPSWGLDGYCPVALVEQSKWVKGDPRWGVTHRGRTYLFSSVDAKQKFWADPDRYAPALSGIDPVLFSEAGQQTEGKRNHGVVYRDHVYLFANEQSLQRFWRTPEKFAEQVRQAMNAGGERRQWR